MNYYYCFAYPGMESILRANSYLRKADEDCLIFENGMSVNDIEVFFNNALNPEMYPD